MEEVPVKDNIPLEPLGGETDSPTEAEPMPSQPLLNNGIHEGDNGSPRSVPTITVTSENGDSLVTKVKVDHDGEDEGQCKPFMTIFCIEMCRVGSS